MNVSRATQAFAKFASALRNLERTLTLPEENEDYRNSATLSFMLAQEAAWKAFQKLLQEKIGIEAAGPKPVLQEAFLQGWLGMDDRIWIDMAMDRNLVAHICNSEQKKEIYRRVKRYAVALRLARDALTFRYAELWNITK
jgi:nucleotidyltransferase substrate binding protein (TIGR01987 family)